ncbi:hypothetical protein [Thauera humireducens]|uniref:hypothetical protein n=1 Tax=Thauera humireducens TaxID=1134435 RepID=UPI00311E2D88
MVELGREALNWLLVLIAMLLVYFGVLRPLLRTVVPPKEKKTKEAPLEPGLAGTEGEEGEEGVVVSLSPEAEGDTYRPAWPAPAVSHAPIEDGRQPDQGMDGRDRGGP